VPLLFLFIVVPVIEIYLLIKVGSAIGALPTILLVVVTAIVGTMLLKQQGLATLNRYQQNLMQGKIPAQELVEGLALVFGGALLLTPGFFTDIIGFLCLIPLTRQTIIRWIMKRAQFKFSGGIGAAGSVPPQQRDVPPASGRTIEGDYSVKDQDLD
jgi:UPF0716 protein FxsA